MAKYTIELKTAEVSIKGKGEAVGVDELREALTKAVITKTKPKKAKGGGEAPAEEPAAA